MNGSEMKVHHKICPVSLHREQFVLTAGALASWYLLQEMNTRDGYNATATLTVHIKDGDDQYPQFLPCNSAPAINLPVCTNPIYMANITEADQVGQSPLRLGGL